jgi:hypothetical protein
MVQQVNQALTDLRPYDVVSIGYPGPVVHGHPIREPHNLWTGWVGFNFREAFGTMHSLGTPCCHFLAPSLRVNPMPPRITRIPGLLCGAPGVKTKILSTKKKGPGCKRRSRSHGERGEVFSLDILSHRMSVMEIFHQQSLDQTSRRGGK